MTVLVHAPQSACLDLLVPLDIYRRIPMPIYAL